MSVLFHYRRQRRPPSIPLGGSVLRPRPLIPVALLGPTGRWDGFALLDTGADESLFEEDIARQLGIDLATAPSAISVGLVDLGQVIRFAQVTFQLVTPTEQREWVGWLGFSPVRRVYPVLGFAGFLQYLTATFLGDRELVELTVNAHYPGT